MNGLYSAHKVLLDELLKFGIKAFCYDSTDSTNARAREHVSVSEDIPALFLSDAQSTGRGRLGRSFFSPCGGLYMTLLAKAPSDAELFSRVTAITAVCASDAIYECFGIRSRIKWVNDLYLGGKKIAGILAECFEEKGQRYIAIGIGVNLFPSTLPDDISDKAGFLFEEGVNADVPATRDFLALCLAKKLVCALGEGDTSEIMKRYREYSCVIGKRIIYTRNGVSVCAVAKDISESGALVVILDDGEEVLLSSGEISVALEKGEFL